MGRLIDADELKKCAIPCQIHNGALTDLCVPLYQIDNAPTVETKKLEYKAYNEGFKDGVDQGIKLSEKPQGKWIIEHDWVHCSSCGHEQNYPSNFCPNCGAKMKGGAE